MANLYVIKILIDFTNEEEHCLVLSLGVNKITCTFVITLLN